MISEMPKTIIKGVANVVYK